MPPSRLSPSMPPRHYRKYFPTCWKLSSKISIRFYFYLQNKLKKKEIHTPLLCRGNIPWGPQRCTVSSCWKNPVYLVAHATVSNNPSRNEHGTPNPLSKKCAFPAQGSNFELRWESHLCHNLPLHKSLSYPSCDPTVTYDRMSFLAVFAVGFLSAVGSVISGTICPCRQAHGILSIFSVVCFALW